MHVRRVLLLFSLKPTCVVDESNERNVFIELLDFSDSRLDLLFFRHIEDDRMDLAFPFQSVRVCLFPYAAVHREVLFGERRCGVIPLKERK